MSAIARLSSSERIIPFDSPCQYGQATSEAVICSGPVQNMSTPAAITARSRRRTSRPIRAMNSGMLRKIRARPTKRIAQSLSAVRATGRWR
jgi:hypothetical protein